MAIRRKRRFRHEDGTRRRNVSARRTVRQEETFPPEGRYGRKRRFRPKDGTTERGVSTTRMVRRGRSRFHHEDGAEKKGTFPPRGWYEERSIVNMSNQILPWGGNNFRKRPSSKTVCAAAAAHTQGNKSTALLYILGTSRFMIFSAHIFVRVSSFLLLN